MIKAKILGEIRGRCGNPRTPPPSLLHLHLPVRLVLKNRRRPPGRASTTQAETVLHDDSLLAHGAGVQDHLGDRLACGDVGSRPGPFSLSVQAIVHLGNTSHQDYLRYRLTRLKHWPNIEAIMANVTYSVSSEHGLI